jgi:hypothetical protein
VQVVGIELCPDPVQDFGYVVNDYHEGPPCGVRYGEIWFRIVFERGEKIEKP